MPGTGNPTLDPDRMGPATIILVDSTAYLVDAGVGVVRRWAAAGRAGLTTLQPWQLHRLFVTHLHSDHTLSFAGLIFSTWTVAPKPRIPRQVYGPAGTRAMTDYLLAAYSEDIRIRIGAGGESEGASPPQVDVQEITPGVIYRDSLVTVTRSRCITAASHRHSAIASRRPTATSSFPATPHRHRRFPRSVRAATS